jgi:hypothetical protein
MPIRSARRSGVMFRQQLCLDNTISDRTLIRKTSLLRDRSNGTRGQAVPASAPFAAPPGRDPFRDRAMADDAKAHGVCEPSSTFIKGRLGTISSSRCQTTRARPGEPGRARIFFKFWTSRALKGTHSTFARLVRATYIRSPMRLAPARQALKARDRVTDRLQQTDDRSAAANLVEPDGIEPTTSCLQSRRSPN